MADTPEKISRKDLIRDMKPLSWCTDWSLIARFCMQIMILCKNADFLFTLYEIKQCPPLCEGANNNISESSTTWMWFYTEAASVPYSWIHAWLDTMGLWFHVYTLLFYAWQLPMYMHYISLLRADFNLMSFPLLGRSMWELWRSAGLSPESHAAEVADLLHGSPANSFWSAKNKKREITPAECNSARYCSSDPLHLRSEQVDTPPVRLSVCPSLCSVCQRSRQSVVCHSRRKVADTTRKKSRFKS